MTGASGGRGAGSVSRSLSWAAEELWSTDSLARRILAFAALGGIGYSLAATRAIGFSGKHLVILLLATVVSATYLSWTVLRWRSLRMITVTVIVLGVLGGVLGAWTSGAAMFFPFIAMFVAGLRLQPRTAVVACALATVVAFDATALVTGRLTALAVLGISAGMVATLLGGVNRAARYRMQEQAELIVAEGQVIDEERARSAALAERARIAREIHDVLAHSLSGLMVQLEAAHLLLSQDAEPAKVAGHVDRARGLARTGLEETRRALETLRNGAPEVHGQLAELADGYQADTGCPAELGVSGTPRPLQADVGLTLCRVAQEALTNVRRHAPGARAELHVHYEKNAIVLTVTDHGGRSPVAGLSDVGGGYGLIGMRERAELLGGELAAGPTTDGWQVSLRVPV
jgi:signal transduction histidine kinase